MRALLGTSDGSLGGGISLTGGVDNSSILRMLTGLHFFFLPCNSPLLSVSISVVETNLCYRVSFYLVSTRFLLYDERNDERSFFSPSLSCPRYVSSTFSPATPVESVVYQTTRHAASKDLRTSIDDHFRFRLVPPAYNLENFVSRLGDFLLNYANLVTLLQAI